MATMVARPYVNHVPTMTGGVGHDQLKRFYKYHFIGGNPADTALKPISRTVGADQIVDEMLFSFTHTSEIDWMLPGVPPTGKRVEIPLVAIVRFEGDKVAHEHIYWDQASVLVGRPVIQVCRWRASDRARSPTTLPSNAVYDDTVGVMVLPDRGLPVRRSGRTMTRRRRRLCTLQP
jgi:hypothetical protein